MLRRMSNPADGASGLLTPLSGPALDAIVLTARPGGLVLGRQEGSELRLPADAETVSRTHARFTCEAGRWRLTDLNSRWGTFVNGCRLPAGREVPLTEGDLIRIAPWTFSFRAESPRRRALASFDDTEQGQTLVRAGGQELHQPLADDLLSLLLEAAAGIHAAQDEKALANVVLEEACRGTGLPKRRMASAT